MTRPELIAALEKLTEPSREIDVLLWAYLDGRTVREHNNMLLARNSHPPHDECVLGYIDPGKHSGNFSVEDWRTPFPAVTASLDAALALVECKLPDANCHGYDKTRACVEAYVSRNDVPS